MFVAWTPLFAIGIELHYMMRPPLVRTEVWGTLGRDGTDFKSDRRHGIAFVRGMGLWWLSKADEDWIAKR